MAKLASSAQEQLDELFINHVAVPGLINLAPLEEPITGFKLHAVSSLDAASSQGGHEGPSSVASMGELFPQQQSHDPRPSSQDASTTGIVQL